MADQQGSSTGEEQEPVALMLYDGDCGFCTYWAKRWDKKFGPALRIAPLQSTEERPAQLTRLELEEALHVVGPDGEIYRGAAAVFRAAALCGRYRLGWWLYRRLPGFRPVSEWVYRWVANHRALVSRWTRWMR